MLDSPSIQATRLAVFAEVAQAGSFSEAARRLGLTRSAVSQRVAVLEGELGVRLLNRTTRSLSLTEAGRAMLPHCHQVASAAARALEAARAHHDRPTGRLVISAAKGPAHALVTPVLPELIEAYPDLDIELRVQEAVVDLVADGVDVVLRAGDVDSTLRGRRLGALELRVCGSPGYLEAGRPQALEDLLDHRWLSFAPVGDTLRLGGRSVKLSPRLRVDDGEVLRRMLLAGSGLGLLPTFYVQADLDAGRLETVLEPLAAGHIWALHPYERQPPSKVRVLLDRLADRVR